MDMEPNAILISPEDNVATVIREAPQGAPVRFDRGGIAEVVSLGVPVYHKIAVADIPKGGAVRKYGEAIGFATEEIKTGAHVHCHNMASGVQ